MEIKNTTEDTVSALTRAAVDAKEAFDKGVDYAKLKWAILRLESNLEESYLTLGRYLSDHRDELTEEGCLQKITALYSRIDLQKRELERLKSAKPVCARKRCTACGATLHGKDAYCPRCGTKAE